MLVDKRRGTIAENRRCSRFVVLSCLSAFARKRRIDNSVSDTDVSLNQPRSAEPRVQTRIDSTQVDGDMEVDS